MALSIMAILVSWVVVLGARGLIKVLWLEAHDRVTDVLEKYKLILLRLVVNGFRSDLRISDADKNGKAIDEVDNVSNGII